MHAMYQNKLSYVVSRFEMPLTPPAIHITDTEETTVAAGDIAEKPANN